MSSTKRRNSTKLEDEPANKSRRLIKEELSPGAERQIKHEEVKENESPSDESTWETRCECRAGMQEYLDAAHRHIERLQKALGKAKNQLAREEDLRDDLLRSVKQNPGMSAFIIRFDLGTDV